MNMFVYGPHIFQEDSEETEDDSECDPHVMLMVMRKRIVSKA